VTLRRIMEEEKGKNENDYPGLRSAERQQLVVDGSRGILSRR
jgi:hypothetical protein